MSRVDENHEFLKWMDKFAGKKCDYQNAIIVNLNVITTALADISKSLAIIADASRSENESDIG